MFRVQAGLGCNVMQPLAQARNQHVSCIKGEIYIYRHTYGDSVGRVYHAAIG